MQHALAGRKFRRPGQHLSEFLELSDSIAGPLLMTPRKFPRRTGLIDEADVPTLDERCALRGPNLGAPASRQRQLLHNRPFGPRERIAIALAIKLVRAQRSVLAEASDEIGRLCRRVNECIAIVDAPMRAHAGDTAMPVGQLYFLADYLLRENRCCRYVPV